MPVRIPVDSAAIVAFGQRWGLAALDLFGSVLRHDFRPDSDIDVLVTFPPGVRPSLDDLLDMQDELEALFGRPVDLLDRQSIEQNRNYLLRRHVLEHLERAYSAPMANGRWRDPKYLLDMLLAARDAQDVLAGLSLEAFEHHRTTQLAVAHALQIIGEAANRVSSDTRATCTRTSRGAR